MLNLLKSILPNSYKRSAIRLYRNIIDSFAFRISKPKPSSIKNLRHIVFVCKGNVCRSVFAEYYLRNLNSINGRDLKIESCGLDTDQGIVSPPDAIQVAKDFSLDLSPHRSVATSASGLGEANIIIAMEYSHYIRLGTEFPQHKNKIRLLREFAPWPYNLFCNIYDPFGLGKYKIRQCFVHMQKALDRLWDLIEKNDE